jgi:beta-aspartyl-peptidase (threonine type)
MRNLFLPVLLFSVLAVMQACSSSHTAAPPGSWAIAIHGGAGVLDKVAPPHERAEYAASLAAALQLGRDELAHGGTALDAVQRVVRNLEENPLFNAGKGAVFTYDATHELDASIMDGATLRCGAVAGVKTVKSPIGLARLVMEKTPHVLLMGEGAEQFATKMAVERVQNTYFDTPKRREYWKERREEIDKAERASHAQAPSDPRSTYGTVGAVALDSHGNLAAATSTGGLTCKRWGRVGDTPVIGAGNYADGNCAVSCTGTGEEFIRHGVARQIALIMELTGSSAHAAADKVVNHKLKPDDGGVIVVSRSGEIAMVYNSEGMFRGAANSAGRFDVAIWEKNEQPQGVNK